MAPSQRVEVVFAELLEKLEEFVVKETSKLHDQNGEENLQRLRQGKVDSKALIDRWTQAYSMVYSIYSI